MSDRRYTQKPIIHSRGSSTDSRTSASSRSSAEGYHTPSSRAAMANGGYTEVRGDAGHHRRSTDEDSRRVPSKTKTTSSSRHVVEIHDHNKARYIEEEPRASKATYEDYKRAEERERKKRSTQGR